MANWNITYTKQLQYKRCAVNAGDKVKLTTAFTSLQNVEKMELLTDQGILSYIIDQRKLLFLKKIRTSDNTVLWSFSIMCAHEYGKILSKYSIHNLWSNSDDLKSSLWRRFVDTIF